MAVDFYSDDFMMLSMREKRDIVITEFTKCKTDFEYFINNYAYIRHPNKGIIQMKPFDFQLDVSIPIAKTLYAKRSEESIEALRLYKHRFDYDKWWKGIAEKNLDLANVIPAELHNFYKITSKHEDFNTRVDTILLKSRQTGLSTIFQVLISWHINFNRNIYDLVMSQGDREAIKFLGDLNSTYDEIPGPLKAKKLNANEHEIWVSITGDKSKRSGAQALPPTAKAGRGYSPNLIVLDEFAEYQHAEKVWTSISMSVSAGGIVVIIATPKGVGNLYHKIWQMTNKSLTITMGGGKEKISQEEKGLSVFRPMAVHWSQLPESEFHRRGFTSSLSWYKHMCSKISMERGDRAIAQELDLDFAASGNTMDTKIIEELTKNCLENNIDDITVLDKNIPGLIIYEPPEDGFEYLLGVDTGEGVKSDYSVTTVIKIPRNNLESSAIPNIVAKYSNNNISVRKYTDIVKLIGTFYNEAWINIERNNHGHVLLAYFIEDGQYNQDKVLNRFDAIKSVFTVGVKGWSTQPASKTLLIANFQEFITTYKEHFYLPLDLCNELKTFIQKSDGKWTAQNGYFDDHVISCAMAILGYRLLPRYKEFLLSNSGNAANEIDPDMVVGSSTLLKDAGNSLQQLIQKHKVVKDRKFIHKNEVDVDELREKFKIKKKEEQREASENIKHIDNHRYMSTVIEYDEDDDIAIF